MPTSQEISEMMVERFLPEKAQGVTAIVQFELTGDDGGNFWLDINDGGITANEGVAESPKTTIKSSAEDYLKIATGELNGMQAVMSGKLKISGDMGVAMKMQNMFDNS